MDEFLDRNGKDRRIERIVVKYIIVLVEDHSCRSKISPARKHSRDGWRKVVVDLAKIR